MAQPAAARRVDVAGLFEAISRNVEQVIQGKRDQIHLALVCLIAEGHLLIEDVPGVGKTSLAKALARSIAGTAHRIQFTPDLLPSDVLGVSVWNRATSEFEFRAGAVFAHVVLADEINRASPKTQSALLEAMQERQVTVEAHTWALPRPFLVIATQNPVEARRHLPAPGGAARPLPHAPPDGLPEPGRRGGHPRDPRGRVRRARRPHPGRQRGRHRGRVRRDHDGARGARPPGVRRRPRRVDPTRVRARARGQPPRGPRPSDAPRRRSPPARAATT